MQEFHQIAAQIAKIAAFTQDFAAPSTIRHFARCRFTRLHFACYRFTRRHFARCHFACYHFIRCRFARRRLSRLHIRCSPATPTADPNHFAMPL
ncbi:hypothetical protein ABU162_27245 [Paenibacillus thiaminolyticus]|uniref:hypothetical protein n=1 Tax=Paenibacillus thiaminolyticus TaxID=49283 RepID=UPI0035A73930